MGTQEDIVTDREILASGNTDAKRLGGAIMAHYQDAPTVPLRVVAIGMAAVNSAFKGIVEANKLIAGTGHVLSITPALQDRTVDDRHQPGAQAVRTCCVFYLHRRIF